MTKLAPIKMLVFSAKIQISIIAMLWNETFQAIFKHCVAGCDMTILCVSNQFGQTAKEDGEGSHTTDFLLVVKCAK